MLEPNDTEFKFRLFIGRMHIDNKRSVLKKISYDSTVVETNFCVHHNSEIESTDIRKYRIGVIYHLHNAEFICVLNFISFNNQKS